MRFTRVHYSVLALLIFSFGAITTVKYWPSSEATASTAGATTAAQKERVRQFWRLYDQATQYRTAGDLEKAATRYAQALELDPNHEDALYYLGNMQAQLGQLAPAETTWTRLVSVNPDGARAYTQLGELYFCALLDIGRARTAYQQALALHNEETQPLLRLAEIALVQERWTDAQRYVDAVIGSNYKSADAYLLNGYLAWRTGRSQQATVHLARAAQQARSNPPSSGVLECALDTSINEVFESDQQRSAEEQYKKIGTALKRIRQKE